MEADMVICGATGAAVGEERIRAVMRALDLALDEPIKGDWEKHLRKLAIKAIEATKANDLP
jgi:hypothetical protein